ncbi:MAG: hypothetical protein ACJA1Z_003356 [Patiriisocius sp.]|jgi:hypothetical protein
MLVLYGTGFAQNPQLFDNTWYLQKLTIDNQEIFPPNIKPPIFEHTFDEGESAFLTGYCIFYNYTLLFDDSNSSFMIDGYLEFGTGCTNTDDLLFGFEYDDYYRSSGDFLNPFLYEITNENDVLFLEFTNGNGDKALFASQILNINNQELEIVSLYPNPVKNELSIRTNAAGTPLEIYTINGVLVKRFFSDSETSIMNLAELPSGVYFIKIYTAEGVFSNHKIVKK